jgi:dolichol-phosphate mannosyltransferase
MSAENLPQTKAGDSATTAVNPKMGPPLAIPTEDAAAALAFCRALAQTFNPNNLFDGLSGFPALGRVAIIPTSQTLNAPMLSVVLPIYNEEENLPVLYERLVNTLNALDLSYELIFVDDGSDDHSHELLRQLAMQDARVTMVELARNFGHQVAISAGLDYSRGQGVIVMDADLQDPPESLPQFIAKWREGYDVVYAIRQHRKEGPLMRAAYAIFYRLWRRIANIEIPLDAGDFCIMDRRVVNLLAAMPERTRFVRGIRSWVGLRQTGLTYERHGRYAGSPKYTLWKLAGLALNGLVSFSYIPLRFITMLGFIVSAFSIVMAILYTIQKLTTGLNPPGFATLVVSIFFLAGIQLMTIGVIGEYVGRIFDEVKRRPLYVVRQTLKRES